MVNDQGQLHTIEGVAAAILMVFTAYIMLSSSTLYTPGETHVNDMQMEQLGNDALAMMDTSNGYNQPSPLETEISGNLKDDFAHNLSRYLNTTNSGFKDNFKFSADISYRSTPDDSVKSYHFTDTGTLTGTEHPMKVTRWVYVNNAPPNYINTQLDPRKQSVLLEVTLWRD